MNEARISELIANEEFVAGVNNLTSIGEAVEYLNSYGVEVSEGDLQHYAETDGELSAEDLDEVSGGGLGKIVRAVWDFFFGKAQKSTQKDIDRLRKNGLL